MVFIIAIDFHVSGKFRTYVFLMFYSDLWQIVVVVIHHNNVLSRPIWIDCGETAVDADVVETCEHVN